MQIEKALAQFQLQLQGNGRSDHTRAQYARHIRALAEWLGPKQVDEVSHEDVARFLGSDAVRGKRGGGTRKATSANAIRSSLRNFFSYAHQAGITPTNAARLVRRARCSAAPPKTLSKEEQRRLLETLAKSGHRRDHALFGLLLGAGLRLGSALAVEADDVDLDRGTVRIRKTKNDAPDELPLARWVVDLLRARVAEVKMGPLFDVGARRVRQRLWMWLERGGVEKRVSPHALRHSFAMGLLEKTNDVLIVRDALLHRSLASTTTYARHDRRALARALGA